MNRLFFYFLPALVLFLSPILSVKAQAFADGGSYMTFISQQNRNIMEDYLSYTSAVAHGKSAKKVENRRLAQLQSTKDAIKKVSAMPPYKGDRDLRDSCVSFLNITYHLLNDDYGKIVNMEEIAEQSYDAMEAYLLAQDLASEKLHQAHERLSTVEKSFATKNNVTLIQSNDEFSKKLDQASRVNKYHRIIYLIFFKSYKQEAYMMDAMLKKNVNGIEQNKNSLENFSQEGISKLVGLPAFDGDNSMIISSRQLLEFYKSECKDKVPGLTAYYLKEENYQKVKKAFDSKSQSERTQADIDQYNKAVNEFNQAVNEYNNATNQLNVNRSKFIDNYNKTSQNFLDKHTPKYK